MRNPFMYFAIPMILGIVIYYYIDISPYLILCLLFLSLIMYLIKLNFDSSTKLNLLFSFLLLGILLASFTANSSQLIKYIDMPVEIEGVVKDIKRTSKEESRYILLVYNLYHNGINDKTREKIILKIIGEKDLEIGDKINFNGILKEPLPNTNPKLVNYKLNLLTDNIYTTATVKDYSINKVEKTDFNWFVKTKIGFIYRVEKVFDEYLEEDNSSLMKAIILAKNSYLEEESIDWFRDLGLAHILAVSGLHIGIITGFLISLFAYIGINRKINISLTIIIIWLYAYIIGNPSSVLRANIMFSLLLISNLWAKPYDSINNLFFALFILILINPFCIFNIGFQLSFIATFFIIYLTPKFNKIFYLYNSNIIKSLAGILSVQIGLLPIQAYYFNKIPIISLFTNLIFVPIFSICLMLSIPLIAFSFINKIVTRAIGVLIDILLNIQLYGIKIFANFPYLNLKTYSPSIMEILLYYILIFILFKTIDIKYFTKRVNKAIIFYLIFLILVNSLFISIDEKLNIKFIDVGQGDSILINTKEGDYLIDTGGNIFGSFDIGKNILFPFLIKNGVFKLKGVFITHYDADHCKSLPYLMDNMKIERIYIGYKRDRNPLYDEIKEEAFSKEIPIFILKKGDKLRLDKNTDILVLGPNEELLKNLNNKENDLSLVLLLDYLNKNILFTGDIESIGEENIINSLDKEIDFLKVPHHGSKTSSGVKFLEKTKPKVGFISVGRNNSFGHPNKEILTRYKDNGIELYRTDQLGLINLSMEGENYTITPFLKERLSIIYIIEYYGLEICCLMAYFIVSYIFIKYFVLLEEEMETIEL